MGTEEEVQQFSYNSAHNQAASSIDNSTNDLQIEWQASEFVDHQKSFGWFVTLIGLTVFGSIIMFLITRSILSTVMLILAVFTFGLIAKQKPRTLRYALLNKTIQIGQKEYIYDDFASFSLSQDGGLPSISLQPLKRFLPILTIYFDPQDGEKIFDIFASRLPNVQTAQDSVERFMKKIRF